MIVFTLVPSACLYLQRIAVLDIFTANSLIVLSLSANTTKSSNSYPTYNALFTLLSGVVLQVYHDFCSLHLTCRCLIVFMSVDSCISYAPCLHLAANAIHVCIYPVMYLNFSYLPRLLLLSWRHMLVFLACLRCHSMLYFFLFPYTKLPLGSWG